MIKYWFLLFLPFIGISQMQIYTPAELLVREIRILPYYSNFERNAKGIKLSDIVLDGSITTSKLANLSVTTSKIADANVTTLKLADNSVTTAKILNANVTTTKLADANVTTAKLADNSVTTSKIANDAVTTAKVLDANVTTAKLADNAVTTTKILDANVTTAKLAGFVSGQISFGSPSGTLTQNNGLNYINGNVGIGTTTPAYPLDVVNGPNPVIRVGIPGGNGGAVYLGNSGHGIQRGYPVLSADNNVGLFTKAANLYLSANGTLTNQFVLQTNGNVGIGTATPSKKLTILDASSVPSITALTGSFEITNGTNSFDSKLQIGLNGVSYAWIQAIKAGSGFLPLSINPLAGNVGIGTTVPAGKFHVNNDKIGSDSSFVVMPSGNVGIGTAAPNAPLQFANTIANRKIILWETGNNDHQFYGFGLNAGVTRYQTANVNADHVFYAGISATTSNELMRITGTGNVSIGTATPTQKLEVSGKVKLTDDATTPTNGTMRYNSTINKFQGFANGVWVDFH